MMKKTGKRFGKFSAILMASALAVQTAFVPVMADDTVSDQAVAEEITADAEEIRQSFESMIPKGRMTSEISVEGAVAGVDLDIGLLSIADTESGAAYASGDVSVNGSSMSVEAYMDEHHVDLGLQGLPTMSYDYTEDPSDTLLAQAVGADTLKAMNQVLSLIHSAYLGGNPEAMANLSEEVAAIYADVMGQMQFAALPEKECLLGGEPVACQGVSTVITGELVADLINRMMDVTLPNGQTYREYMNMVLSLYSSQGLQGMPASVDEFVETYKALPEIGLEIYVTETGVPVECTLTAEDSSLQIQLRGPADAPWSEIAYLMDGTEMAVITTDVTDSDVTVTAASGDTTVAELVIGLDDMSFVLSTIALPASIMGNIEFDDEAVVINAAYDALSITARMYQGGTVEEPSDEGGIKLNELTEEEFNEVFTNLGALFGSFTASDTAASGTAASDAAASDAAA